ncbi:MAG: GGDEF domain-containing protein [Treponema sp.]
MQSDGSLDVFRRQINGELSSIEITAAAICFFNPPVSADSFEFFSLPKEAIVLSAFDISTGFQFDSDKKPIVFNPQNEIIPDGLFKTLDGMYVVSLFRASVQYGYLIFRPGSFDMIVYNMISSMFSTALAFAYNISCVENEKKQLEKEYTIASQISITDEMTGLLNRRGFISLSQKTLEVAQATSQTGMILYGDMDGLKKINDTYGHNAGDIAIKAESEILKKQFRSVDIIGRMGGDEFAITASGMTDEKYKKIRKQIIDDCKEWNKTSGEKFQFSISIGAATFSSETKNYNIKNLLDIADAQLYEEKKSKKTLRKE